MRIAVCDDDRAIREELIRLVQRQVAEVDITGYLSSSSPFPVPERKLYQRRVLRDREDIFQFSLLYLFKPPCPPDWHHHK